MEKRCSCLQFIHAGDKPQRGRRTFMLKYIEVQDQKDVNWP